MENKDAQIVEELDFVSPKFNAQAVLKAEGLEPPCPEVCGFNSLREYEMVVRERRRLPSSTFSKNVPTEEQDGGTLKVKSPPALPVDFLEGMQEFMDLLKYKVKHYQLKVKGQITLTTVADLTPHRGPLGMLQQWYHSNALVRVWIRHSAGVRGVCAGRMVAFDKHWNIVLKDVEETFVPFDERNLKRTKKKKKRKAGSKLTTPDQVSKSTSHDQMPSNETSQSEDMTECTILATPPEGSGYKLSYSAELYRRPPSVRVRAVPQLFIRGDNIVLIAKTQSHNT